MLDSKDQFKTAFLPYLSVDSGNSWPFGQELPEICCGHKLPEIVDFAGVTLAKLCSVIVVTNIHGQELGLYSH